MLILFDVDATLITTTRTGIRAIQNAGTKIHGPTFDGQRVRYAGRLDPLIIAELLQAHHTQPTPQAIQHFADAYHDELAILLKQPGIANTCPGIPQLLQTLRNAPQTPTLGLLTGNYERTGSLKLRTSGIEPQDFPIRVWGDASPHNPPHRSHLPPIALQLAKETLRRDIPPHLTTIIGDTPHDITCAKDNNMRALAVATGSYSIQQLKDAGADLALSTLEDTQVVAHWLLNPTN